MKTEIKNIIAELLKKESKAQRETFEYYGGCYGTNPFRYSYLGLADRADLSLKHLENNRIDKEDYEVISRLLTEDGKEELINEIKIND